MNWYDVFYWISRADDVKGFFDGASNTFMTFTCIFFVILIIAHIGKAVSISDEDVKTKEDEEKNSLIRAWELVKRYSLKLFYPFLILTVITWAIYVFVPSKKDALFILAGGAVGNFLTKDSAAKQLPSDITSFLHLSLKKETEDLTADAKRELGIETPKDRLLEKAKDMTKEELINYIKADTTVLK